MSGIKFGTDGWRAITDKDFNDENVVKTTKAIAKYISDNFGTYKKVLIGFDARRKADYMPHIPTMKVWNLARRLCRNLTISARHGNK